MMDTLFWIIAVFISICFGAYSPEIFVPEEERNQWNIQQKIFQAWFNFIGSIIGWTMIYFLLFPRFDWGKAGTVNSVGATDIILLIIGVVGITGLMPMTIMGMVQGSYTWLKNLLNKMS